MYTPETGSVLNRTVHFYAYESLDDRDRCRKRMLEKQQWTDFLQRSRPCVLGPQVGLPPVPERVYCIPIHLMQSPCYVESL